MNFLQLAKEPRVERMILVLKRKSEISEGKSPVRLTQGSLLMNCRRSDVSFNDSRRQSMPLNSTAKVNPS